MLVPYSPVEEVNLVYVEQLLVERRDHRRVALIIVVDELDGSAEQTAVGIDILLPDLLGQQGRLCLRERGHRFVRCCNRF